MPAPVQLLVFRQIVGMRDGRPVSLQQFLPGSAKDLFEHWIDHEIVILGIQQGDSQRCKRKNLLKQVSAGCQIFTEFPHLRVFADTPKHDHQHQQHAENGRCVTSHLPVRRPGTIEVAEADRQTQQKNKQGKIIVRKAIVPLLVFLSIFHIVQHRQPCFPVLSRQSSNLTLLLSLLYNERSHKVKAAYKSPRSCRIARVIVRARPPPASSVPSTFVANT